MNKLREKFEKEIKGKLQKDLGLNNPMQSPRVIKIVVNMGVRDALVDKKNIEKQQAALSLITGQKPRVARAKKSIASFKLRQGDPIGLVVTLRGERMYDFMEKIITVVLPRLKDFRGIKRTGFDESGNYTLGIIEHTVFPEIDIAQTEKIQGMEISFVNTAKNREEGLMLLEAMGMPFAKEKKN